MAKKTKQANDQGKPVRPGAKGAFAAAQDLKTAVETLHSERASTLLGLMKETEEVARATSFLEAQIDRQSELLGKLKTEKESIAIQHQKLSAENSQVKSEVDSLSKIVSAETSSNRELSKKASSLKSEISKLEGQNEKLSSEIKSLEKSADRLRTDVERLEAIRKEYVDRIAKFREMREDLIR